MAPIFLAIILAMMLVPVANFLEKKGLKKGWAALLADMLFVLFIVGTIWAVGIEIKKVSEQWSSIEGRLNAQLTRIENFVENNSPFSIENPMEENNSQQNNQSGSEEGGNNQPTKEEQGNGSDKAEKQSDKKDSGGSQMSAIQSYLTTAISNVFTSLGNLLLISVYIFFMLLYREKFNKATLNFIPDEQKEEGKEILAKIVKQAQQFLVGKMILVLTLTIIYSIGFAISGMESIFTIAFLAAVLSLIPYIGPLIGGVIAIGVAYITTGETSAVIIVFTTYAIAQFMESYLVEPFLVGNRIKVNPLFTILAIIIGAAVWGVIGMIVFLPLFSFIKSICDHVPLLHPVAYAIGNEDSGEGEGMEEKITEKVKGWFKSKK